MELLRDNKFIKGFYIGHVDALISRDPIGTWNFKNQVTPVWKICQWCTNNNLIEGEKTYKDNKYSFKNSAKEVIYDENNHQVSLEVLAQNDYLHPRVENEGWPHLLLEQFFEHKFVSDFKEFRVKLDASFEKFNDFMNGENNALHTCQFQWFFAIGKNDPITKETKDFFWFGIGLSDYPRYIYPPAYQAVDGGKEENTNKFINIVDSRKTLKEPFIPGKHLKLDYDAMDDLKAAFATAKARGYLKNVEFDELEILSTNIGIEMTGTYQAKFTIRSLSVNI